MEVRLEDFPGGLRVSITDNGDSGPDRLDPASEGMGTRGMHERAVVIGGVLTIDHARSGSTVVVVVDEACPELVA
jgi:signal transduction histidine kinase